MASEVSKGRGWETLSMNSLVQLAHGLAKDKTVGLSFALMLNLPTITVMNIINENTSGGLAEDEEGAGHRVVLEKCILLWRQQTAAQKNKDRIKTLERALRELGKDKVADAVLERFQNQTEISSDIFQE